MTKTIKIGHASTSSGAIANNVLIKADYNVIDLLEPNIVLRPKTFELAKKSADACEAGCNNDKIGYSQSSRLTLYNQAKEVDFDLAKVNTTCYTDCSAFMSLCAIAGGAENIGAGQTCGTMKNAFKASRAYKVLTDKKYLTCTDYLQRGDILVRDWYKNGSRHTVMVLENGCKVPSTLPEVDLYADFFAISVGININSLTPTKLSATAKMRKIEHSEERALTEAVFNKYNWKYTLRTLSGSTTKSVTKALPIAYKNAKFTLAVKPATSYVLTLHAFEKTSDVVFNSPNIIFTTPPTNQLSEPAVNVNFKDNRITDKKCKTFIRIKDSFKRAVVYHE